MTGTRSEESSSGGTVAAPLCKWAVATLLFFGLTACQLTPRPTPPPAGSPVEQPWGAISLGRADATVNDEFVAQIAASLREKAEHFKAAGTGGKIPYRALTLSGGGAYGAYGAGVLTGWTKAGTRPDFDVVTGISTGALMATHAFLGSEFDKDLELYKEVSDRDIFRKRGFARALRSDAVYDTMPLRRLLSSMITEELLERVAAEHQNGRRLFIGTTNLDADTFTIWDMGMIARSTRPDRRERYIDVVLASASFPIAFPPVYIDVEGKFGSYTQMHADGGVRETVFFFDFLEELEAALALAGLEKNDIQQDLYLLINGDFTAVESKEYKPVDGGLGAVAGATVASMMNEVTQGSVLRLWILAMADGADFHLTFVPSSFELNSNPLSFDPVQGKALYDLGYRKAVEGTAWATQRAPTTTEEFVENVIRGVTTFDRSETPEWLEPEDKH
jgi:hypothetical protein